MISPTQHVGTVARETLMEVLEWITAGLLVFILGGIGMMKLTNNETGIEQAQRLGYDHIRIPIGIAEVAAVIGVVIGAAVTDLEWIGMLAGVVIVGMMIGAAGFHIRAKDRFETIPSIVVAALAILYMVALNAS